MRTFDPHSTSNPTLATIETISILLGRALSVSERTALWTAAGYIADRNFCRTARVGYNEVMRQLEREFHVSSSEFYIMLKDSHNRAYGACIRAKEKAS